MAPMPETAEEIHETIYDGSDLMVHYSDGRSECVKVRKIPRKDFAQYASLMSDEESECGFYVEDKDSDWANSLSDESFDAVLEKGQHLNFPRFISWYERQSKKMNVFEIQGRMAATALSVMEKSPMLSQMLASMNGSLPKATPNVNSGTGVRKSSGS